jgi:hypothetical protein
MTLSLRLSQLALLVSVLLGGGGDAAGQVFYTPRSVLGALFPSSQRVTYRRVDLSPEVRRRADKRLGYPLPQSSYTFYIALSGDKVDGYALIDDAPGQYLPITYAVKFSPTGELQRLEIMVYREKYGSEVGDARFRRQFLGKTLADPLVLGGDIVAVSGATISSRALSTGIRRALYLLDELILHPPGSSPPAG